MESVVNPAFWRGRNVLVTGHTGFKGSWLTLWLQQLGARVHGLALPAQGSPSLWSSLALDLPEHLGDLRDRAFVAAAVEAAQPEVVLHLAAQPLVRASYADPVGTWATNVMGSLHLLEALRPMTHRCAVVMVTTDKVYHNREWPWGYRESDRLGGHDPYSASKAGAELAIASWRSSFCGSEPHQTSHLAVATARAGNVIGGGDWAEDRIVPDAIRALCAARPVPVRSPQATRPWQHVLEPLAGYLMLAQGLYEAHEPLCAEGSNPFATAFNFGPAAEANRPVRELVTRLLSHWPGQWLDASDPSAPHEAGLLHLVSDRAHQQLQWHPRWDFATTVERTATWYRQVHGGEEPLACCLADLNLYQQCQRNFLSTWT